MGEPGCKSGYNGTDIDAQENAPTDSHIYSRDSAPNSTRLETVLGALFEAETLTYASGLAAFHALIIHANPKRIAIGDGYHGVHGIIKVMNRLTGLQQLDLDCAVEDLGPGDVIHVETPLNPTGEARDLAFYAEKARKAGAILSVDATFAPPPLLDPFKWGADIVMHSGTKYLGGHSDMLCGVLVINPKHKTWYKELKDDRLVIGSVMGTHEGWLGLRSLRTLSLRVNRQSATTTALVQWLEEERQKPNSPVAAVIDRIQHASLQPEAKQEGSWLRQQMPNGYGSVFSMWTRDPEHARRLPSKLFLFNHGTSLGGVESLIEWRAMTDVELDKRVLRLSIGVEDLEDLKADLLEGFRQLQ